MRRLVTVWKGLLVLITLGSGASAINLVYVPDILRRVFGSAMRTGLSLALIAGAATTGVVWIFTGESAWERSGGAGLLLAALSHAGCFWALGRRLTAAPGLRLLILRVFDNEATSSFLFSGLTRYWRHFGNHFTIVDAALVRQQQASGTWSTAFIVLAGSVAAFIVALEVRDMLGMSPHGAWAVAMAGLPAAAAAALVWAVARHRIDTRFTRRHEDLQRRIDSLERHPRRFDQTFRHARALCHDNTWFTAVARFAEHSDAMLMDLRGYTPQRTGCRREVDFLFDAEPLARLLFLVDARTDEPAVQNLLRGRWQHLCTSSPNRGIATAEAKLFVTVDDDERDMQAILDHLIDIADRPRTA